MAQNAQKLILAQYSPQTLLGAYGRFSKGLLYHGLEGRIGERTRRSDISVELI